LRTIAFKTTSEHLEREFGAACRDRYWKIIEALFEELGYRDYLGALQRYRIEHPTDIRLLGMSLYLVDYPFADRLYPGALEVLNRLRSWGQTVILSDGDVVFQPRKVERSGISEAVGGHVLIYIHKEQALADVERRYPAERYVMVDDKLRILAAMKKAWGDRVTTVFPRQDRERPGGAGRLSAGGRDSRAHWRPPFLRIFGSGSIEIRPS